MEVGVVRAIVEKYGAQRGALISILEDVQEACGYLPADALEAVAEATGRPLVDVYGVATFYRAFSLKPRGEHICTVCLGTACHVRGAPAVATEFEKQLRVERGNTTDDGAFTLETVNCLGACALGPIVVIDGHYVSNVSTDRVREIVAEARSGAVPGRAQDGLTFPLALRCPKCNHDLMDAQNVLAGHPSVALTISAGQARGSLRLSGVYGVPAFDTDAGVEAGTVVQLFCPHCVEELHGGTVCPECDAMLVPLLVEGGGILQVCSRLGCGGHVLDLSGAPS